MARKLHEVLGSQSQVFTQAEKCRTDLANTFEKKRHLFGEKLVHHESYAKVFWLVVQALCISCHRKAHWNG